MNDIVDISVIIPLYNKENYILKTVESVLIQKGASYEIIIVNDGSKDNSLSIVEKIIENYPNITLVNIENGGVSNARNVGLKRARGTWIQFLDADDTLKSNYFEKVSQYIRNDEIDIMFTNFDMIDEHNQLTKHININTIDFVNQSQLLNYFMDYQYQNGYFGYISNKLIRKHLIDQLNVEFPINVTLAEDLAFYVQIYPFVNKALFTNIDSFNYLQTDSNYIFNENIDYKSQLWIQLLIKKWIVNTKQYNLYKNKIDKVISNYVYFTIFDANEKNLDITGLVHEFYLDENIHESINLDDVGGLEKKVLLSVKKNKTSYIKFIFNIRNLIRMIYRKVIKK